MQTYVSGPRQRSQYSFRSNILNICYGTSQTSCSDIRKPVIHQIPYILTFVISQVNTYQHRFVRFLIVYHSVRCAKYELLYSDNTVVEDTIAGWKMYAYILKHATIYSFHIYVLIHLCNFFFKINTFLTYDYFINPFYSINPFLKYNHIKCDLGVQIQGHPWIKVHGNIVDPMFSVYMNSSFCFFLFKTLPSIPVISKNHVNY